MREILTFSRAIERVLIIAAAVLCIYLGHRLLLAMPEDRSGEGKVILPMGASIMVSRVGPGAFLSLFGCTILALALHNALKIESVSFPGSSKSEDNQSLKMRTKAQAVTRFTYLQSNDKSVAQDFSWLPEEVLADIYVANQLPRAFRDDLDPPLKQELEKMTARAKLAFLQPHWRDSWGSLTAFREWVSSGFSEPRPSDTEEACRLFNYGKK